MLETSYADHFLHPHFEERSLLNAYSYEGLLAAREALEIVSRRDFAELHELAQFIEDTIQAFAESMVHEGPYALLVRDRMGAAASEVELGMHVRRELGDLDLWLGANHRRQVGVPPLDASRADLLATFALWKVQIQAQAAVQVASLMKAAPGAVSTDDISPDALRLQWAELVVQITALMGQISNLTGQIVRAGTLARETVNLEDRIAAAKHDAQGEIEAALRAYQEDRLKQAGSLGGVKRAEKYAPIRDRAHELYLDPRTTYPSRAKAAEQITDQLRREGMSVEISTVQRYLKELDDERTSGAKQKRDNSSKPQ